MSYSVSKNIITLTRGDTFKAKIVIKDNTGNLYIPQEGDLVEFGVKKNYNESEFLIKKIIPNESLILELKPEDTKTISYGSYVYDMKLTKADGEVTTFITKGKITLTEGVC